jgi:hypothetical protein
MEQIKRARNNIIDAYDESKRKKINSKVTLHFFFVIISFVFLSNNSRNELVSLQQSILIIVFALYFLVQQKNVIQLWQIFQMNLFMKYLNFFILIKHFKPFMILINDLKIFLFIQIFQSKSILYPYQNPHFNVI